ncbi:MAG: NUDIX domain-containing protein [Terriglobales bacterium]
MEIVNAGPQWTTASNRTSEPSAKFIRLSHLRKLKQCEQVAAVCYRIKGGVIEFLLVRTRGGRWIFPKGNSEPGLTHAQAAALEAFEEAGVHGRIEEACFIRYTRDKRDNGSSPQKAAASQVAVHAHLCEVTRLEPPREAGRNPTWFIAEKAMRRLRDNRNMDYGASLAAVIDCAVKRIQKLRSGSRIGFSLVQGRQFTDASPLRNRRGKGPLFLE